MCPESTINLGYNSGLVYDYNDQPIFFSPYFLDQREWKKAYSYNCLFRNDLNEIEKRFGIVFPLKVNNFRKLSKEDEISLRSSLYAVTAFNIYSLKYKVVSRDYKYFIRQNLPFIAPIVIHSHLLNEINVERLELPSDLLEYIRDGKAKIYFSQHTEGFINTFKEMHWFNNFIDRFGLPENSVIVSSANAYINELRTEYEQSHGAINFLTIYDSHFENRPWFWKIMKLTPDDRNSHYNTMHEILKIRRQGNFSHHFLCLNRRLSEVRAIVFYYLASDEWLKKKAKISLGNAYGLRKEDLNLMINQVDKLEGKNQIINFYRDFNFEKGYLLDVEDLNSFNHAATINYNLHNNTFVSIVNETYQLPDTEIFFSEKTFRPIYTIQPFLLFGNPGSLKKLRELGYKTFSDWWDESYDDNVALGIRLERLRNTIYQISAISKERFKNLHFEMENILMHNFNTLMSLDRISFYEDFLFEHQQNGSFIIS